MTTPILSLLVLRSAAPERTVEFYQRLGVEFMIEQHGKGPIHWAADLKGTVVEIYPATMEATVDTSTRLGFRILDLIGSIETLRNAGETIVSEPKKSDWGVRAVVRDPDGRSVELLQL